MSADFPFYSSVDPANLLPSGQSANAVSAGAVLRAFKKEDGPTRKLQSSYGLIRKEPLNRDYEGHRRGQKTWDDLEATYFVKDTILWKFVKVRNSFKTIRLRDAD